MAGVIADGGRLRRTQEDFLAAFERMGEVSPKVLRELKASDLYSGNGPWYGVEGAKRHELISELCDWLCDRKHRIALAAIDKNQFDADPLSADLDGWMTAALHVALQIQYEHQKLKKNKGATFLVFDQHQQHADQLAELLFDPPAWTDAFYGLKASQGRLNQVIDTAFYARSHHVGLVQVADLFAFVFRRYAELVEYEYAEAFEGEITLMEDWVKRVSTRLLPIASRWPKNKSEATGSWYRQAAPGALVALG